MTEAQMNEMRDMIYKFGPASETAMIVFLKDTGEVSFTGQVSQIQLVWITYNIQMIVHETIMGRFKPIQGPFMEVVKEGGGPIGPDT